MGDSEYKRLFKIAAALDEKIKRQINGSKEHFISASYPSSLTYYDYMHELHDSGFDNYPVVNIANPEAIFFMEKIIGCKMRYIDGKSDFFHTFCIPYITKAGDVDKINIDLSSNLVWNGYYGKIQGHTVSPAAILPISLPAFCPLDTACAIMGVSEFLTLLADDMCGANHVIDFICDLYIAIVERIKKLNVRTIGAIGYPGTYISDLNTINISPKTLEKIMPFYEKTAEFCGGMTLNIAVPDISLMRDIVNIPSFYGFFFDSRLKLKDISKILGKKLFIIYNYIFDDKLDKVTLKEGVYVNPIVHAHSRNITEVFDELAEDHSIMALICRNDKQETIDVLHKIKK